MVGRWRTTKQSMVEVHGPRPVHARPAAPVCEMRREIADTVRSCSTFCTSFSNRGSGAMVARDTPNVEVPGSSPGCRCFFCSDCIVLCRSVQVVDLILHDFYYRMVLTLVLTKHMN